MVRLAVPAALAAILLAAPAEASGGLSTSFWQKQEADWLASFARRHVTNPVAGTARYPLAGHAGRDDRVKGSRTRAPARPDDR